MSSAVRLLVEKGPCAGQQFEFERPNTFLVGRGRDCHVRLPNDSFVSRHHFIVFVHPPSAAVRDLGSQNGTYVNGTRIPSSGKSAANQSASSQPFHLKSGDRIQAGKSTFCVEIPLDGADHDVLQCEDSGALITPRLTPEKQAAAHLRPTSMTKSDAGPLPWNLAGLETDTSGGASIPTIPGYTAKELLGEGGLGVVYRAADQRTGRIVAVKLVRKALCGEGQHQARFLREMDILRGLRHPNIVQLEHCGFTPTVIFFVMELCTDGNLEDYVKRSGKGGLSYKSALKAFMQLLRGLAFAHDQGIVHRDIKPSNILLTRGNKRNYIIKISDFGLAKQFQLAGFSGLTTTGECGGSMYYMAKEQLVDYRFAQPRSDVWSAAATFYFMLTGEPPRQEMDGDLVRAILEGEVPPLLRKKPNVPPKVAAVVEKALESEPEKRFRNGGAFLQAMLEATEYME
jgi:pSer/pThr/pTyr-binding forkhead associated (FHA) protein